MKNNSKWILKMNFLENNLMKYFNTTKKNNDFKDNTNHQNLIFKRHKSEESFKYLLEIDLNKTIKIRSSNIISQYHSIEQVV